MNLKMIGVALLASGFAATSALAAMAPIPNPPEKPVMMKHHHKMKHHMMKKDDAAADKAEAAAAKPDAKPAAKK
ncbi:hypothetical protein [Phenylobacterium sp.]|uniref:hypothetical protein n=1 Tax=Phenylobacterium sp. TaxID=1871053 RepID=UPI00286D01FF|nr:hypothetical protein [Phenylobacterium sp.]